KADTIVRVQARRLRAKLADYYGKNGHTGTVVIELHKGSYIPVFASQPKLPKDTQALPSLAPPRTPIQRFLGRRIALRMFAFTVLAAGVALTVWVVRPAKDELSYTQITNFTDSAMAPVLSRDGRMVAFFRSDIWLVTPDQIYIKMLPNGKPVQVTHDPRR